MRCEWREYPHAADAVYICTNDEKDWYEEVNLKEGAYQSLVCAGSILTGYPQACLGYAKWFVESVIKILAR